MKPDNEWGVRITAAQPFNGRPCFALRNMSPWQDAEHRLLEAERAHAITPRRVRWTWRRGELRDLRR